MSLQRASRDIVIRASCDRIAYDAVVANGDHDGVGRRPTSCSERPLTNASRIDDNDRRSGVEDRVMELIICFHPTPVAKPLRLIRQHRSHLILEQIAAK